MSNGLSLLNELALKTPKTSWENWLIKGEYGIQDILEILVSSLEGHQKMANFIINLPLESLVWKDKKKMLVHELIGRISSVSNILTHSQNYIALLKKFSKDAINEISWTEFYHVGYVQNYDLEGRQKLALLNSIAESRLKLLSKEDIAKWHLEEKNYVFIANLFNKANSNEELRKSLNTMEKIGILNTKSLSMSLHYYFRSSISNSNIRHKKNSENFFLFEPNFMLDYLFDKSKKYQLNTNYVFNTFSSLYFNRFEKFKDVESRKKELENIARDKKELTKFLPFCTSPHWHWAGGLFYPEYTNKIINDIKACNDFLGWMKNNFSFDKKKEESLMKEDISFLEYIATLYENMVPQYWEQVTDKEETIKTFSFFFNGLSLKQKSIFSQDSQWYNKILEVYPGFIKLNVSQASNVDTLMKGMEKAYKLSFKDAAEFWLKAKYSFQENEKKMKIL